MPCEVVDMAVLVLVFFLFCMAKTDTLLCGRLGRVLLSFFLSGAFFIRYDTFLSGLLGLDRLAFSWLGFFGDVLRYMSLFTSFAFMSGMDGGGLGWDGKWAWIRFNYC